MAWVSSQREIRAERCPVPAPAITSGPRPKVTRVLAMCSPRHPPGCSGMQVKILTRTMKVKSEHHKVSGSSSAKAHRIRAANLPSHRLSEIQRSEVLRSAGGKLSPIGYSWQRKPASINETIISCSRGHSSQYLASGMRQGMTVHATRSEERPGLERALPAQSPGQYSSAEPRRTCYWRRSYRRPTVTGSGTSQ